MTRYFAQNTPRAGLEHMMMSVPGFQKRGGGMMILSRFCYKPEDVDCRYCLHYRRRSCQVRTCPYIAERLKSGAIEYLDLILEYFGHIPHAGLHKRIQAVEHWSGPDQAVLHTVSVHLRSRFADRVWDDAPPGYLAALYLLASKERLWQPALPALSHDSIDFSRIVSKPHGFAIQDYPIFYSARRLYDLKSPMEAEDLAHPKLVSDLDFHNIIVQSITGQLQKNYGKEGSEIIVDNCQVNLYGGFAPASQTAVELSKSLGSRTVMSGSISRGKNDPSQSLQMMERPLMTPDELKSMPKGSFIVAKTGAHPMKVKLRLFLDWGIRFRKPYEVPEKAQRSVAYADKQELEESIIRRHYGTIVMDSEQPQGGGTSAGGMAQGIQAAPDSRKTVFRP